MAGYALLDIEILDQTAFDRFRDRAPTTVEAHGGKFLVRGGATDVKGDWTPHRVVLVEFDSMDRARSWRDSPERAALREALDRCAKVTVTLIEGVSPSRIRAHDPRVRDWRRSGASSVKAGAVLTAGRARESTATPRDPRTC